MALLSWTCEYGCDRACSGEKVSTQHPLYWFHLLPEDRQTDG